jgi:hypothetical protein
MCGTFSFLGRMVTIYCCCVSGRNLEHGLRKEGFHLHLREFDGSEDNIDYADYLRDVSKYARGESLEWGPTTLNSVRA